MSRLIGLMVIVLSLGFAGTSINAAPPTTIPSGFKILTAKYGAGHKWVDVTEKVSTLVKNGRLRESSLGTPQFGDVYFGKHKSLIIVYSNLNRVHIHITSNNAPVSLPTAKIAGHHHTPSKAFAIMGAMYGAGDQWMDVTVKLRKMVTNGVLKVPDRKNQVFGEPARNKTKALIVLYSHKGQIHLSEISENQRTSLPGKSTLVIAGQADKAVLLAVNTVQVPVEAATPKGAILLLSFDRDTINNGIVKDLSGKGNHCQIKGATQTKGVSGDALMFNGKGDVVAIMSLHSHIVANLKGITLSAWVQNTKGDAGGKIFEVGFAAEKNVSLMHFNSLFSFHMPTSAGGDTLLSKAKADNRWHHVVGVWNGKDQRIYVDGKLSGILRTKSFVLTPAVVSANTALLGGEAKRSGKAKSRYFKGAMDEVAIFNRALSALEVIQLFKARRSWFGKAPPVKPANPSDPIAAFIAKSTHTSDAAIAQARNELITAIDLHARKVAQSGDLDAVIPLVAQKQAFESTAALPKAPELAGAVQQFKVKQIAAQTRLIAAYDEGVKAYTKQLKIDEASALKAEQGVLKARLATLVNPNSNPAIPVPVTPVPGAPIQPVVTTVNGIARTQSTVRGLMVQSMNDENLGFTMDIIATGSRNSRRPSLHFRRRVGKTMSTSLDEVGRVIRLQHPDLGKATIEISFGDKYSEKNGGSAGAAFAVAVNSLFAGFEVDQDFAITGDVAVNGKVKPVGAVVPKIRGAILDKVKYVAIPESNSEAMSDLIILYSPSESLAPIQVFTIATIDDAVALLRKDRDKRLAQAIDLYSQFQQALQTKGARYFFTPEAKQQLSQIQLLAPNHLSAKYALQVANRKMPSHLSRNGSLRAIFSATSLLNNMMWRGGRIDRQTLPKISAFAILAKLNKITPKTHPDIRPLHRAMMDFVKAIESVSKASSARLGASVRQAEQKRSAVVAELGRMKADQKLMEKLLRDAG